MKNDTAMRYLVGLCVLMLLVGEGRGQEQTEDQKRVMDLHKKKLVQKQKTAVGEQVVFDYSAVHYLLARKRGVGAVEDALIEHAAPPTRNAVKDSWMQVLIHYEQRVAVEDMPDKIIPVLLIRFEWYAKNGSVPNEHLNQAAQLGPRGKVFLPALEKLRDQATSEQGIRRYREVINSIKQ
jgi:hypothetical protein